MVVNRDRHASIFMNYIYTNQNMRKKSTENRQILNCNKNINIQWLR